jgi:hypothetical protein
VLFIGVNEQQFFDSESAAKSTVFYLFMDESAFKRNYCALLPNNRLVSCFSLPNAIRGKGLSGQTVRPRPYFERSLATVPPEFQSSHSSFGRNPQENLLPT